MAFRISMAMTALVLTGLTAPAGAMPALWPDAGSAPGGQRGAAADLHFVGGDCSAAAQQVVDQTGGQLLSAQPSSDGQSCIITVLVQGDGTSRPRRIRVQVPM